MRGISVLVGLAFGCLLAGTGGAQAEIKAHLILASCFPGALGGPGAPPSLLCKAVVLVTDTDGSAIVCAAAGLDVEKPAATIRCNATSKTGPNSGAYSFAIPDAVPAVSLAPTVTNTIRYWQVFFAVNATDRTISSCHIDVIPPRLPSAPLEPSTTCSAPVALPK